MDDNKKKTFYIIFKILLDRKIVVEDSSGKQTLEWSGQWFYYFKFINWIAPKNSCVGGLGVNNSTCAAGTQPLQ